MLHFGTAREGWKLELKPQYLLVTGPYRYTRNPMYLGGIGIWLGWAIFYGSLSLLLGVLVLAGAVGRTFARADVW